MSHVVLVLPAPSTSLLRGVFFKQLPQRICELSFEVEDTQGGFKKITLLFEGVEAYKCTYLTSLTVEMIDTAYGQLVDLNQTDWLREINQQHRKRQGNVSKEFSHLMICFDDGPCYEFICQSFKHEENVVDWNIETIS